MAAPNNSPNPILTSGLSTDFYEITMCYSYWKHNRHEEEAVFEISFRKYPFNGNFAVFTGLAECLDLISRYSFTSDDIDYLQRVLPSYIEQEFYSYLLSLNSAALNLFFVPEGHAHTPTCAYRYHKGPPRTHTTFGNLRYKRNRLLHTGHDQSRPHKTPLSRQEADRGGLQTGPGPQWSADCVSGCIPGRVRFHLQLASWQAVRYPLQGDHVPLLCEFLHGR